MSISYTKDQFDTLDHKILNKVRLLQFETPAESARFLITGPGSGSGAGSALLETLIKELKLGYLYDRTLLYDDKNLFYDFCFKPIGRHLLETMGLKVQKQPHFNFLTQRERAVHFEAWHSMEWGVQVEADMRLKYGICLPQINYTELLCLPYNSIYVNGLLLNSFLQLKEEYRAHIEKCKRKIGFKNPVIGLHIRQGEVMTGENPAANYRLHPPENFFQTIERVASETGIKTVFVTSDSEAAIRNLPKDSGINFIYDEHEKRYDNFNFKMVKEHTELKKQETLAAIKNIYLLGECDYIVGTYSCFVKYALALFYHRNKRLNGILMRRQGDTEVDLEYITTGDSKLPASVAPVLPYTPTRRELFNHPWLR